MYEPVLTNTFVFVVSIIQHYKGDLSELELYFVVVNNEYGEQKEEELVMGGKDKRVTNENVITYIHLIANHRLNYQVICYLIRVFISNNLDICITH